MLHVVHQLRLRYCTCHTYCTDMKSFYVIFSDCYVTLFSTDVVPGSLRILDSDWLEVSVPGHRWQVLVTGWQQKFCGSETVFSWFFILFQHATKWQANICSWVSADATVTDSNRKTKCSERWIIPVKINLNLIKIKTLTCMSTKHLVEKRTPLTKEESADSIFYCNHQCVDSRSLLTLKTFNSI